MKCKTWLVGVAAVTVLGLLDLKCKGSVYRMLPANVQQQVDSCLQK